MFTAYIAVTVLAAAANGFAAILDFLRHQKVLTSMARLGVPESWLPMLGILKAAAGAVGLVVGIGVPVIGAAAAVCLALFFVAAIITHLRTRDYSIGTAVVFLLLAAAALVLRPASF
jgi:DoxX-like family